MSIASASNQPDDEPSGQAPTVLWVQYECHKVVRAAPIDSIIDAGSTGLAIMVRPYGDDRIERFYPSDPAIAARAEVGFYAIVYADGYRSVSPKVAFETGYTAVSDPSQQPGAPP